MKIAVLGANGMLGSMLVKVLSQQFEVVATVRREDYIIPMDNVEWRLFDANVDIVAFNLKDVDWIINAIGVIPQRKPCSYDLNWCLSMVLSRIGTPVIQIGTDCVFDGTTGNYTENSPRNATDKYGLSKIWGERLDTNSYLIRCSIVGPETHGKSLLGWFLNQSQNAVIDGYTNHLWNGVTTMAFAQVCAGIIANNTELPHIQHLVPADAVSKYELLCLFREYFKRQDITINPVEAPEPINRTLATNNPKLNRLLWHKAGYTKIPTIEQMVKEMAEWM